MNKPTLYVVAGANGSGKSTLINKYKHFTKNIKFINPDDIAQSIDSNYDGKDNQLILKASRETIKQQNALLQAKKTFGIETTLSGKRELRIMQEAKKLGYKVKLIYVGLDDPRFNIERVNERTKNGGHYVYPKTILNRYNKSLTNLESTIKIADKTYLIDNSQNRSYLIAKFQLGKVLSVTDKTIPNWIIQREDIYQKIEAYVKNKAKRNKLFPLHTTKRELKR